ncbi:uncharacterized protein LACBIDRAFT_326833 [Laccaria bicolor S238N-H82]|uniref:Predicted protein n=1 Tax=Laccaria bicolor (strain S238N-H82 / ATCC MYA-4686) TaxID=486041 RepID=B0D9U5_LACBS|nr:uncharacterized protein LACBIDRAFT_326833 [Laccaria bicolor S238N-H82]EDR08646.1 predicted protein [Laccaria bicolor S238N-H82]|eukprot:XP_001880871.1 predicted protein [Laccaria bicolor S238N-H82]
MLLIPGFRLYMFASPPFLGPEAKAAERRLGSLLVPFFPLFLCSESKSIVWWLPFLNCLTSLCCSLPRTLYGFFALASGRRLAITKPGAKSRTWYCYYSTTIQTSTGNILPADLRIYSPINDVVHPDNTIAFVIAKAYIPPNDTTFLDVLHLAICPGDPSSESYEESLPDCPYPWIFGVGHVPSKSETLTDTNTKIFPVSHTEYLQNEPKNVKSR